MAVNVETLEKLERKITLTLPVNVIQSKSSTRLRKRLARTVKMDGFRPGKVPMNVVAQRYGYSVHYEVMNDKVGEAFSRPPTRPSCAWPASPHHREGRRARRRAGL
jgi:trigger factor